MFRWRSFYCMSIFLRNNTSNTKLTIWYTWRKWSKIPLHLKPCTNVHAYIDINFLFIKFISDFETWRYAYQREHNSNYVSSTGRQKNRDGSEVLYFNCSRSGRYKCQSRPDAKITRSRVVPTQKLGGYCPSSMKVIHFCSCYSKIEPRL